MRGSKDRFGVHGLAAASASLCAIGAVGAVVGAGSVDHATPVLDGSLVLMAIGAAGIIVLVPVRTRMLLTQGRRLRSQGGILAAAAFAAERFASPDGLGGGLPEVLRHLGEATGVSRVYVFANTTVDEGELAMSLRAEWVASGIAGTLDDAENQSYPYARGFGHWVDALSQRRPLQVVRSEAGELERVDMESEDILSLAAVPIFVGDDWWGYLGFDDCQEERVWSLSELDALQVAAGMMGAALTRERAIETARAAEERHRVLVEQMPAVVYVDAIDESASSMYISPQVEPMLGYTVEEWNRDPDFWPKVLHPDDREVALEATERHNRTGEPFRMEYRLLARDGRVVWIRDEAIMIRDAEGRPSYSQGIMQDITEVKAAEHELQFLALHDGLTRLPNHAMFGELAELALARARRGGLGLAVMFLDLDGFKLVNDTLGHDAGDELLLAVAERLGTAIRETDTLARRGGDEFLILLSDLERGLVGEMDASLLFAESVAGRIREVLATPIASGGTEVYVSTSIGISIFPDDAASVGELVANAESAMRDSKDAGPGGFAASDAGVIDAATRLEFVTKLRHAVAKQEWVLHYQPIVELATGAAVGVEALLRWQAADGEIIPPNEFIPLAEELGLIEAMGDWVVEELVRQDARWRSEGLALEIGFNLSPRQFRQDDLAERILTRLDAERTDPTNLVVEITESSAMRDPERAHAVLWDLHARGLRLAIDDFGTGYSSLSRLRSLPIDVLKIDRSFVSEADRDPQSAQIVAAFIQLGQGLGMTTLAEGIETEGEWRFLAQQGCELGQGYYFSRPVPAEEISARYAAGELLLARRG
jgi:diguanylate cyclase (GGDEF)-like protein/PAS domain S-box-containing protein